MKNKELNMTVFDNLVGKRLTGLYINERGNGLRIRTINKDFTEEDFFYATVGECCNSVWINHISGTNIVRGALVIKTEEKGWSANRYTGDDKYENDIEQDGFWTILTDRGYIDLEVRNSHNGYYGGDIMVGSRDSDEYSLIVEDF
jgi:hypothetical protein